MKAFMILFVAIVLYWSFWILFAVFVPVHSGATIIWK
jgi:hypothetical protein